MGTIKWATGTGAALTAVLCLTPDWRAKDGGQVKRIRIGLVPTLFRNTPAPLDVQLQPLKTLIHSQTGITRTLVVGGDAFDLARKLKENKVQLGVFHGFEFAWARQHNPGLRPLVVVVSPHPQLHAHLVVRKDSPATDCGELKGKVLAIPHGSREHCRLYLERLCPGTGPRKFFGQVTTPASAEDALDDVVDRAAQAALVDRRTLDQFQNDKPERFSRLRILARSETFPANVIAYQERALDKGTLRHIHDGLVGASKSARGRELLKVLRITAFKEVPADYDLQLRDIACAYPPRPEK